MQAIGCWQVIEHLREVRSLPETLALVKQRTWQFARRQMTWLRHQRPGGVAGGRSRRINGGSGGRGVALEMAGDVNLSSFRRRCAAGVLGSAGASR